MKSDVDKLRVLNKLVEHYGYQNWWENENRIEDWVAMILIQRTTERNCHLALDNLEGYFTAEQLLEMDLEKLRELIRPAGFNKQKSVYIKELMEWYKGHGFSLDKFKDIPTEDIRTELLSIKGVGPETADAMLLYIFERNVFIADTYAIRLFNRLGFGEYKTYAELRADFNHLTEDVSNKLAREWHAAIDVHGKAYGRSRGNLDESWLNG